MRLVREIVTHPRVWPWVSDDYSSPREEWRPAEHPGIWYVAVRDDSMPFGDCQPAELLGLVTFIPQNGACWEFHACLLPNAGTRRAHAAILGSIRWIWERTECRRVVTNVPAFNRQAMRCARAIGLESIGVNRVSYMKDGKLHDQVLFGLSPEEK
jgi:RimJ/RimL family protein N-acetyltransferase